MEKLKKYKNTDAVSNFDTIKGKMQMFRKMVPESDHQQLYDAIKYFVPKEILHSRPYLDKLNKVQSQCSKFWNLKDPLSYDLGCHFQTINFDYSSNVNAEINRLENLKKLYSETNRNDTIGILDETIFLLKDLEEEMCRFFENLKT